MEKIKKIAIVCLIALVALNIIFLCQPISTIGRYRKIYELKTTENNLYDRTRDSSIYFDKNTVYIEEKTDYTFATWEDYTDFYVGLYKVIKHNDAELKGKYLYIVLHDLGNEPEESCTIYHNLSVFSITKLNNNSKNEIKYINKASIVIQIFLIILIAINAIFLYKLIRTEKTA